MTIEKKKHTVAAAKHQLVRNVLKTQSSAATLFSIIGMHKKKWSKLSANIKF